MAQAKTRPTGVSVDEYLASKANPEQLKDCLSLIDMCRRATGQPARMWGPSIVGFGTYSYRYESGHSGEAPLAGFAVRGRELVVYLSCDDLKQRDLLKKLGKHKVGRSCLYFKRLADLDTQVLETLVMHSIASIQRRHACASDA